MPHFKLLLTAATLASVACMGAAHAGGASTANAGGGTQAAAAVPPAGAVSAAPQVGTFVTTSGGVASLNVGEVNVGGAVAAGGSFSVSPATFRALSQAGAQPTTLGGVPAVAVIFSEGGVDYLVVVSSAGDVVVQEQ